MYKILNMHPSAMPFVHSAATESEINRIIRNIWHDADFTIESAPHHGVKILRREGKPALAVFGGLPL